MESVHRIHLCNLVLSHFLITLMLVLQSSIKDAIDPEKHNEEPPKKKRRNTDPLSRNYREALCMEVSQKENYYLGTCSVEITEEKMKRKIRQATNASHTANDIVMVKTCNESKPRSDAHQALISRMPAVIHVDAAQKANRRAAINYIFVGAMQSPAESRWNELDIVRIIMRMLGISKGSAESVKSQLRAILAQQQTGRKRKEMRGRKLSVPLDSPQARLIYRALSTGLSTLHTTVRLNRYRVAHGLPIISKSAIQGFVQRSDVIDRSRRLSIKSGKKDENSPWAKARLNQFKQFQYQLGYGDAVAKKEAFEVNPMYIGAPPMNLDGIVWWDEHHRKVILGHVSKYENRVSMKDGVVTSPAEGGVYPPKKPNTVTKYADEARGLFGVAVVQGVGVKAAPFNYSSRLVVGVKAYDGHVTAELNRVKVLKGVWGAEGAGYVERYSNNGDWQVEVKKVVDKKYCSIKELIDHIISESKKLYKGTDYENTFLIFHDALSSYFEHGAQEYINSIGFKDRLVKCYGDTNSDIKRYKHKLVGDTPELCPLDAHLFSDFKHSVSVHCSLTSVYDIEDEERFHFGTPAQIWSTLTRVWEVCPTPDRIKEDIMAIRGRIDKIIEYKGALCPDEEFRGLRNGRRYVALHNPYTTLQQKPRASARKSTLANYNVVCHRHCIRAEAMLQDPLVFAQGAALYATTTREINQQADEPLSPAEANDTPEPTEEDNDT